METRVSRVKNVTGNGTWESNHGLLYSFIYEMEDGSIFKANHKTQNPLDLGQEAEYTITKQNAQYGDQGKIKKYNPQYAGKSFNNSPIPQKAENTEDERQIMIVRQTVLKAYGHAQQFPTTEECYNEINKAVEWVMSGKSSSKIKVTVDSNGNEDDNPGSFQDHKDNMDRDNVNDSPF